LKARQKRSKQLFTGIVPKKTETNGEETCEKGKPPRTNPATKSPHQEAKKESRIKIESFLGIARFFFLSK